MAKSFSLKEGDVKRMPITLTQNGAALTWTPDSVKLRIGRNGNFIGERDAEAGDSAGEWFYDWTADDYSTFPGGYVYDCELVVTKPASVDPAGPETAPTRGRLKIDIEKAL